MGLGILLAAGAVGISAYNIWDSSRAEAAVEASLEAYEEELTAVEQESEALPVDENSGMTFVEADGLCWIGELENSFHAAYAAGGGSLELSVLKKSTLPLHRQCRGKFPDYCRP